MKILLDEQVPEPALDTLQFMLPAHQIDHVQRINWKGKPDLHLIPDMAKRGYKILVTADVGQLENHEECAAIKKSGIHHVRFKRHGRGIPMTASAIATVVAGIPAVLSELGEVKEQRLVELTLVKCGNLRYRITDPEREPPTQYWPGRKSTIRRRVPRPRDSD